MPADEPRLEEVIHQAGLSQRQFAALGGWLPSTVNRWCRQRDSDGRPVPRYAWALILAYSALPQKARDRFLERLDSYDKEPRLEID